ncbi:hypothetical protein [Lacipirellula limnantheis]|uniref:Uncharacterized protein n=1 Tax=Lacipirellula limnantheis TaxID=2528024 RepID=A0A517U1N0_9BACT|nr:hypothetical protein [Lacipirellula limnantheis]QDT74534.1 hypothetical protein I41_37310 [Lacipirellula limnantheis]
MKSELISEPRIKRLLTVLTVLCATPMVQPLIPFNILWMPLFWAASAIPVGALLTVSFWVGMGNYPLVARLLSGLFFAIYAALWGCVSIVLVQSQNSPNGVTLNQPLFWITQLAQFALLMLLFGGMFMVLRHWWRLERSTRDDSPTSSKAQFSILNILLLTAVAAVVMALIRVSRSTAAENIVSGTLAATALGFGVFFFNTACAAFATLSPTPTRRNCILVLSISAVLGVGISVAAGQDRAAWCLIFGGALISVIPTAVVLLSLLVVRSVGYRLIRKSAIVDDAPLADLTPMVHNNQQFGSNELSQRAIE